MIAEICNDKFEKKKITYHLRVSRSGGIIL